MQMLMPFIQFDALSSLFDYCASPVRLDAYATTLTVPRVAPQQGLQIPLPLEW